ncbi:MAG: hypothetical protein ACTSRH_12435 [Promethearchaeota archaeon]
MKKLILLQPIEKILLEDEKEEYFHNKIYIREFSKKDSSLELLNKFKKFVSLRSLKVINPYENLPKEELEYLDFILKDRIRKKLKYVFLVDLGSNFYLSVLPECPHYMIYRIFILFKSSLDELETNIINFINKKKKENIFSNIIFRPYITINCKIEKEVQIIRDFINLFNLSKNGLFSIRFNTFKKNELDSLRILLGKEKFYLSIDGDPSNLEFLLFIKEYFSRF